MTMDELPSGWHQTSVGSVAELLNGKAFKPSDWSKEGLPIVRIQNLNNSKSSYNRYAGEVATRFLIDSGDLLFAWSGTPGTSFGAHVWNGGPAVLNQHIFNMRFDENLLDKAFFRLAINQKLDELIGKARGGVGLRHVTKGKFEETQIPVPPLTEQRRIVAKIDSLSAKSRRARDNLSHVPRLVEKFKQAILATAFRGNFVRLDAICEIQSGLALGKQRSQSATLSSVPYLRVANVQRGSLDLSSIKQTAATSAEVERLMLRPGDILMNEGGDRDKLGRGWVWEGQIQGCIHQNHVFRLRLREQSFPPRYVSYYTNEIGRRYFLDEGTQTTNLASVSKSKLAAMPIPVPTVKEALEIVQRIETAFAWIDRLAAEASSARKLIDNLDQAVLAKAFRGELVPQDPADEPASVLMDRISAENAGTAAATGRRGRPRKLATA